MAIQVQGNAGVVADVTAAREVMVRPTLDVTKAGLVAVGGIIDPGTVTGFVEAHSAYVSEYHRLNVGMDQVTFNDAFNYTAQNTSNWRAPVTTQTVAFAAGYAVLNSGSVTTINTNSAIQTLRTFSIYGSFELRATCKALHTAAPQANAVTEWGLFSATLPGAAAPADGAFFRFTSSAAFVAVLSYNGTETVSASLPVPAANVNHSYKIVMDEEHCEFWANGVLNADFDTPAGQGQPVMAPTQPFTARHYIAGSAPASAMQFKVSDVDVVLGDMNTTKPWAHVMSGQGLYCYQGQNGGTLGSTANYANSANPAAAVPTNTTAALGTGLGGQFWETATLAVNTDGIISSFQNPAHAATQAGRALYITGIKISSYVQAAVTGGPYAAQWSLAFGHTAVSLATAESATAKAPRRIALGNQIVPVTAAASTLVANDIVFNFDSPPVVLPGEFVATVIKHVGTVGTAGTIAHSILFDAYFE